ncbi:MAG TPA: EAL domain-containing protein [Gallionella sp.]
MNSPTASDNTTQQRGSLLDEQTKLLYVTLAASLTISTLLALILTGVQRDAIPAPVLSGWLAAIAAVLLARLALLVAWQRNARGQADIPRWLNRFRAGAIANGIVWGAGAWLLFPAGDVLHQVLLAFILAGLCAGAVASLAIDRLSMFGFMVPALAPLIARFTVEESAHAIEMAVMVALFLFFVTLNALRVTRSIRDNILYRIDADEREYAVEEAFGLLRKIANRVPGVVYQFRLRPDGTYCFPFASEATRELFRVSPEEIREDASGVFAACHPDDLDGLMESIRYSAQHLTPWHHELRTRFDDGTVRWLFGNALPQREADGSVLWHGFITDITEQKLAETDLRIAATAFEAQEGIAITDANNVILRVNQSFTEITGYPAADVLGKTPAILSSGRHDADYYQAMWESLKSSGAWQGEIWNRRKNGEIYPEWLIITAVRGEDGAVTHYVAMFTDITKRKAADEEIRNLAFYDPLTRLPNRRLLRDRLRQAMATSVRNHQSGALLIIDLDNFKLLNDTLGHDKGDLLLQQVSQRLAFCVRDGDTVARLGGDEFVVMLEDLSGSIREAASQAEATGEKILDALNQKYQLGDQKYHSTPSIGVALFGGHQQSIDELLKQAELAMYQAKGSGRNALRFFDPEMQSIVTARAALENDLRQAIAKDQFLLHFQPQANSDGLITGFEALLRWHHPEHGMITPDRFIALSEEIGAIQTIGQWVLETACTLLAEWAAQPETSHLTMSVNVSAQQFRHPNFVGQVLAELERTRILPNRLKLEITESLMLHDVEEIIVKMTELKARGVSFSLDDFGTGYSSLSYLKRLPLDQLKIDQSFVRDILTDPNDAAIARTVVALAQSLGLAVIAEGVETEAQRDFLLRHGCRNYQGYLFGKPLPAEEVGPLVRSHNAGRPAFVA